MGRTAYGNFQAKPNAALITCNCRFCVAYPALVIVVLAQLSVVCWSREKGHLSPLFLLVAVIGEPVRLLFYEGSFVSYVSVALNSYKLIS